MTPIQLKTREYLKHLSSPAFLESKNDKDPARVKAAELKKEIDAMEFEKLSPRNKLHDLVEKEVAEERQEDVDKAEEEQRETGGEG